MEKEEMIQILQDKFNYPKGGATLIAEKISQFQPELLQMFTTYIKKAEIPLISVEGYDFDDLINQYKMTPIAGFLTLDWLMREPEKAKQCLLHGYDSIGKDNK